MSTAGLRCTAIVPTLDRPRDLEACLRSLAAASPPFAAVIVADQGATRELEPLVTSLGATYLHLERRGLSHARNVALGRAGTPWLYFPDDDCTVSASVLDDVARALSGRPQAGFVAARVVTPAGTPVMAGMDRHERVLVAPGDVLSTVMSPGLFVSARVFERCGAFDESFGVGAEWPSGEESDLLFRAFAAGETGVYAAHAVVTHPEPFSARDKAARLRFARDAGRARGALLAKHAAGDRGAIFHLLHRHLVSRVLGDAVLSALSLGFDRAARHLESWRGLREGWQARRAAPEAPA